ncbi:hypothetical protein ACFXHA_41800 [Nocardia sp. NPDC059240]|uniref:YncE family protein n=1 Tax=Nocardia sp. NPDC059240 TaxID=3346786 RepID=UPI0036905E24
MDQPHSALRPAQYAAQPAGAHGEILGVAAFAAEADTAMRLSRATALARWRSPAGLGFIATIPLILMVRHIVDLVVGVSRSGSWALELAGLYLGLLAVTIVIGALLTAVAMVRRSRAVMAYATPGATMTTRYQRDSLELTLATGTSVIAFGQIRELFAIGDSVFLRVRGARGIALPRELFPEAALQLMGRRLGSRPQARRTIVIGVVMASVLVAVGAALGALSLVPGGIGGTGHPAGVALRKSIPADYTSDTIAAYGNVAYIACFDGKVRFVDLSSGAVTAAVPVGQNSFGIAFDPATRLLYVGSDPGLGHNGKVTVIDTDAKVVRTTIGFDSGVWKLAIDSALHRLYVGEQIPKSRDALAIVDTGTNAVVGEVQVGESEKDIAVDSRTHLVYVGSELPEPIQVIDVASMKVTATIAFGDRVRGLAVDPQTHSLVAIGDETGSTGDAPRVLKIIDTVTNTIRSTLSLAPMAWGLDVDPSSHTAYVLEQNFAAGDDPKQNYESTRALDTRTGAVTSAVTIASGKDSEPEVGLAVDPVSHVILVADSVKLALLS